MVLAVRVRAALVAAALAVATGGHGCERSLAAPEEPHAAATGAYRFSEVLDGRPVRWDPCRPVHWVSSTAAGPAGGLAVLKASVARVSRLTGTTWVYDGAVSTVPSTGWLPRSPGRYPPVLIGWATPRSSDLLRGRAASVVGMTRTVWFGTVDAAGAKKGATRAAVVALDATDRMPLQGGSSWTATTLHELGHVVGLDHAADRRQLMAPVLPRTAADFQAGDRAGLVRVGRAAGCVRA